MKLLIAIPALDFMHTEFVASLLGLTKRLTEDGIRHEVRIESGTLVYLAREKLANRAVDPDNCYTHVLWLDSDMVFTPDLLDSLMFSGKEFVSGICHGRRRPFFSCLFSEITPSVKLVEEYPKDTFEIAACGFGAVLMTVGLLADVQRNNPGKCFMPTDLFGEDVAFCHRCTLLGHKLYAEPSARLGHIGHIAIYPGDEEKWKEEISNLKELSH